MAWVESHQAVGEHPKTIQFAELLHVSMPTAVGHLHYLWWWALDYAPDGKMQRATPAIVAHACRWRGQPERFWSALVEAGFIDVNGEGPTIHDWDEYAGKLIDQRELRRISNREAQQRRRQRLRVADSALTVSIGQQASDAYVIPDVSTRQHSTVPDQPDLTKPDLAPSLPGNSLGELRGRARENGLAPMSELMLEHQQRIAQERGARGKQKEKP